MLRVHAEGDDDDGQDELSASTGFAPVFAVFCAGVAPKRYVVSKVCGGRRLTSAKNGENGRKRRRGVSR